MIFTIFARFLKSYMRFDVKISFLSVFCFRCTYYKPRATENWRKWVQHRLCAPPSGKSEMTEVFGLSGEGKDSP